MTERDVAQAPLQATSLWSYLTGLLTVQPRLTWGGLALPPNKSYSRKPHSQTQTSPSQQTTSASVEPRWCYRTVPFTTEARRTQRRGYTLVEVVVATMLVGLVLVGAMNVVGASIRGTVDNTRRTKAVLLANDLMGEILQQYYIEPDDTPAFGVEGDEASETTGPRILWDDVDDYNAWDASPPQQRDGTPFPDAAGWRRWVTVRHVDPDDLSSELDDTDDQGVKKITVNVSYQGQSLARLVALHTKAWIDMIPDPGNDQTTGSIPAVNQPPVAVAAGEPTSGTSPVTVSFDATASRDPDGDSLNYSWDFDDGENAVGSKPSHTFTNTGSSTIVRTVTLTATDVWGAVDTDTITITIYPP